MRNLSLAALSASLPDRKLKLFVVGIGLGFWACWGASGLLLVEGHPLAGLPVCGPIDGVGLFWECATGGKLQALMASGLNALFVLTLAMPVFVAAANLDPALLPLALPGLTFHAIGLPAGLFVLVRSLRRLCSMMMAQFARR
jgi:hypothetical protein